MKIPYKWLKDYVDINVTPTELADALTLSGSKVEEVIITGDIIKNVVTGKITKIEKHKDADRLSVCQVNIGSEDIQIVTAASNMKEQDIVPVALHKSILADGTEIKKGKMRGEVSNGMFCSKQELGLEENSEGLLILPEDTVVGADIKDVLGLTSAVIDFEITSNRPDCLSVVGMARETAATFGTHYTYPISKYTEVTNENIKDKYSVEVKTDKCRRYVAKLVKNVKIESSPAWMQERLNEASVRPINNIVDITNFVMLELGQPMHAFDTRDIKTNKIVIDNAKDNEKFTTLDEVERTLDSEMICIKDGDTTVALAGIMGGLNSEVKDDTTEVLLEFANFNGTNVRVSSKKLALRTEASGKFEKDIDPNLIDLAIERACGLIEELGAGQIVSGVIDIYNEKVSEREITVDSNYINRFLGTDLSKEQMAEYLDRLELSTEIDGDNLNIKIPTFRNDISIKEDIAEEIVRIFGYDNVPETVTTVVNTREIKSKKQLLDDKVVNTMTSCGLNQSISYTFISPKVFDLINVSKDSSLRNVVTIKNPLSEDYSIMRTTILPCIMENLGRNYSRNNDTVRLFEIGKVYVPNEDENKIPEEINMLVVGIYGGVDYLNLKGIVENLIDSLGVKGITFSRETENTSYHPGKTANLYMKKDFIGTIGEIHPDVAENYGVDERCYVAQINLDALYKYASTIKKYSPIPKYPAVTRDIALLVDDEVLVAEIEDTIRKNGGSLVENVKLFDVYKGKQIPEGKKSIAYSIVYRSIERTLKDEEVTKVHSKILKALEFKLQAELR